ncbi:hypothetical protein F5Y15DRAFT_422628 [Xylariaceae sp. FL0016]|nr:hypothetical protein F5Y15DRAFT_422628 [Xylariaceae sp. FL0016]
MSQVGDPEATWALVKADIPQIKINKIPTLIKDKKKNRFCPDQTLLLASPYCRPIKKNPGFQPPFNPIPADNITAAIGYSVGDVAAVPCHVCTNKKGFFEQCILPPRHLYGKLKRWGCFNCSYNWQFKVCDHDETSKQMQAQLDKAAKQATANEDVPRDDNNAGQNSVAQNNAANPFDRLLHDMAEGVAEDIVEGVVGQVVGHKENSEHDGDDAENASVAPEIGEHMWESVGVGLSNMTRISPGVFAFTTTLSAHEYRVLEPDLLSDTVGRVLYGHGIAFSFDETRDPDSELGMQKNDTFCIPKGKWVSLENYKEEASIFWIKMG